VVQRKFGPVLSPGSTAYNKNDWDWDDIPGIKVSPEFPYGYPRTEYIRKVEAAISLLRTRLPKLRSELQAIPHWDNEKHEDKNEEYKQALLVATNLKKFYEDALAATQARRKRKDVEDIIGVQSTPRRYEDPSKTYASSPYVGAPYK